MATQIGLSHLHYAIMKSDPAGGKPTYESPVHIPGAIEVNINANTSSETLFADDGPMETATALGEIEVEINIADLPLDVQAKLLGHTIENGVMVRKSSDTPPFIALGFKSLKSNGKYRYVWLTKGKFNIPELNHKTKEDGIEFQTPTITASFVKRESDDVWIAHADEDDTTFTGASTWFNKPWGGELHTTP